MDSPSQQPDLNSTSPVSTFWSNTKILSIVFIILVLLAIGASAYWLMLPVQDPVPGILTESPGTANTDRCPYRNEKIATTTTTYQNTWEGFELDIPSGWSVPASTDDHWPDFYLCTEGIGTKSFEIDGEGIEHPPEDFDHVYTDVKKIADTYGINPDTSLIPGALVYDIRQSRPDYWNSPYSYGIIFEDSRRVLFLNSWSEISSYPFLATLRPVQQSEERIQEARRSKNEFAARIREHELCKLKARSLPKDMYLKENGDCELSEKYREESRKLADAEVALASTTKGWMLRDMYRKEDGIYIDVDADYPLKHPLECGPGDDADFERDGMRFVCSGEYYEPASAYPILSFKLNSKTIIRTLISGGSPDFDYFTLTPDEYISIHSGYGNSIVVGATANMVVFIHESWSQ